MQDKGGRHTCLPPVKGDNMAEPKVITIKELEDDKAGLGKMLEEQRLLFANTQATILRLEGAHVYVSNNLKRLQEEQEKEGKDAPYQS